MGLDELRTRIDAIDAQILDLLNERARNVIEVGKIKHSTNAVFYVPEREKAVFDKLAQRNKGPLPATAVRSIWREVISSSRALEKPTAVAFLGPLHTFSELAAQRIFGATAELPCRRPAQNSATVWPMGVTTPMPVTTTRRLAPASAMFGPCSPNQGCDIFMQ